LSGCPAALQAAPTGSTRWPFREPYRSELEKHDMTVIDLIKLKSGDALKHGKFAKSPEVVRLIVRDDVTAMASR
jgi:esterase/lipase superfamily enzyme